jgi:methylase of polypeptide subunit release factors
MHFGEGTRFNAALEWCSGPGFIGFALLAEHICDSLCLVDINPEAIQCVARTIDANQLQNCARGYVSDNLSAVPEHERFDFVVASPPACCNINSSHSFLSPSVPRDLFYLLAQDPNWQIHSGFYGQIGAFLNPGAILAIVELEPYKREVIVRDQPWDVRPEVPAVVFEQMMRAGGLQHIADRRLAMEPTLECEVWVQVSQKPC